MDTKNEQSVGQTHENGQSQGVAAVAPGSARWCWTEDLEAEIWHGGGASKIEAMLAAQREGYSSFWVAPTRPAGEADVSDWMGDDDIEVGDPMIDVERIEEIPLNGRDEPTPRPNLYDLK